MGALRPCSCCSSSPVRRPHLPYPPGTVALVCKSLGSPPRLATPAWARGALRTSRPLLARRRLLPSNPGFHIKATSAPPQMVACLRHGCAAVSPPALAKDAILPDTSRFGPPPPAPPCKRTHTHTHCSQLMQVRASSQPHTIGGNTRTQRLLLVIQQTTVTPSRFQ